MRNDEATCKLKESDREQPAPRSGNTASRGEAHEVLCCLSSVLQSALNMKRDREVMWSSQRSYWFQPALRAPAFPRTCSQTPSGPPNSGDVEQPRSGNTASRGEAHEVLCCLSSVLQSALNMKRDREVMWSSQRSYWFQPALRAPAFPRTCSQTPSGPPNSGDVEQPRSGNTASRGEAHEVLCCLSSVLQSALNMKRDREVMWSSQRSYWFQPALRAPAFPRTCSQTPSGPPNSGDCIMV